MSNFAQMFPSHLLPPPRDAAVSMCNAPNVRQGPLCPQLLMAGDAAVLRDEASPAASAGPAGRARCGFAEVVFTGVGPGKGGISLVFQPGDSSAAGLTSSQPDKTRRKCLPKRLPSHVTWQAAPNGKSKRARACKDTGDSHKQVKTAPT